MRIVSPIIDPYDTVQDSPMIPKKVRCNTQQAPPYEFRLGIRWRTAAFNRTKGIADLRPSGILFPTRSAYLSRQLADLQLHCMHCAQLQERRQLLEPQPGCADHVRQEAADCHQHVGGMFSCIMVLPLI